MVRTAPRGHRTTSAATAHYSCDNRTIESTCASGLNESDTQAHCDGTVLEGACPLEGAIGTCTLETDGGVQATNTYYEDGPKPHTEAEARKTCEETFGGTFAAIP